MVVLSPGIAVSIWTQGDPPVDLSQSACHILAPEAPAPLSNLAGPAYPLAHIAPSGPSTRLPPAVPAGSQVLFGAFKSRLFPYSSVQGLRGRQRGSSRCAPSTWGAHLPHGHPLDLSCPSCPPFPARLSTFLRAGAGPRLPLLGCWPGPC